MNLRSLYVVEQNDLLSAEQKREQKDRGAKKAIQVLSWTTESLGYYSLT